MNMLMAGNLYLYVTTEPHRMYITNNSIPLKKAHMYFAKYQGYFGSSQFLHWTFYV